MEHDPALEAHEHAEHAEHAAHARDPFISKVSITVAVLAVLAATAGSLETVEGGRAITESVGSGTGPGQGHRRLERISGRQPETAHVRHRRRDRPRP